MSSSPSGSPLLVIEECFVARGPGVLVMPRFALEGSTEPRAVRLVRPDGTSIETRASIEVAHMRGALAPWAMYRLPDLKEDDAPPGTVMWLVENST